jgi:hypothetical protein
MDALTDALRDEVNVPAGDDERIERSLHTARAYVGGAIGTYLVPTEVMDDCVLGVAADLYNSRSARLGVMDLGDSDLQPFRIPTDPLRSAWPKLNAIGVPTGSLVIA